MADRQATRALVAHIAPLRRYARLLTGGVGQADDLVQDTLERALRKWHLYDERGSLRSWLLALMHNRWVSQLRREQPYQPWDDDLAAPLADTSLQLALRLDTERALERLAPAQRAVLLLVVAEELSYAEVAAVLDIPIGTVMSRLSRARGAMRAQMEGGSAPASTPTPAPEADGAGDAASGRPTSVPHLRVVSDRTRR